MALANVATELAARGRRVLMIDFDLEAPGLDTFPFNPLSKRKPGLVDLIAEYRTTDAMPDVSDYIYEVTADNSDNSLWIMAAGKQDSTYDESFKSIDWPRFYEREQGFLFFEDLKIQWKDQLKFDYVLIDSRTGHTDVGGICTRQLPDSVVVLFFPDEQNLRGLVPIVEDIRREGEAPLDKSIGLHFVMSNVPNIPDEAEILSAALQRFKDGLHFSALAATVYHFNSLSMISQKLFVTERAKTPIAAEYRDIVNAIIEGNYEDREGALAYLDRALANLRQGSDMSLLVLEKKLNVIKATHPNDVEVLRRIARIRRFQRRLEEALDILDQIDSRQLDAGVLIARAEVSQQLRKTDQAIHDISRIFTLNTVTALELSIAIRLKLEIDPTGLAEIVNSPAMLSLSDESMAEVSRELQRSPETLPIAVELLTGWLSKHRNATQFGFAKHECILCLIGCGKFSEALSLLDSKSGLSKAFGAVDLFNRAMAEWGLLKTPPTKTFSEVAKHLDARYRGSPNQLQCEAIAKWASGDTEGAKIASQLAEKSIQGVRDSNFSAWSYLLVPADQFLRDLSDMDAMFAGFDILPSFISRNIALPPKASALL